MARLSKRDLRKLNRYLEKQEKQRKNKVGVITTKEIPSDKSSVYVIDYEGGGSKTIKTQTSGATGQTTVMTIQKSRRNATPQISRQIITPQFQTQSRVIITPQSASYFNRRNIILARNRARNKLISNVVNTSRRLYNVGDVASSGKLTMRRFNKRQDALNKEIEDFNKKYEGKKELEIGEYRKYSGEYKNLEEKQKAIEENKETFSKSKTAKVIKFVNIGQFPYLNKEEINRELKANKEDIKAHRSKIEELENKIKNNESKGKNTKILERRLKLEEGLLKEKFERKEEIKSGTPIKIMAGYPPPIIPAPLGTPTGFKGFRQGLRDLYGIKLKTKRKLNTEIKSYYLKPSKSKLKKIKLTRKRLDKYNKQINAKVNKFIKTKKISRKRLRYLGKVDGIKVYQIKKTPKPPKVTTTKIPSKKTRTIYLGKSGNIKAYKQIKINRANINRVGKVENIRRYRYLGKYNGIKFYKKLNIPKNKRLPDYGVLGRAKEINKRYSYIGNSGGVKVYKLKGKFKSVKFKPKKVSREIVREIKQRGNLREYYINNNGQIVTGKKPREIVIDIRISKPEVRKFIKRTWNKIPARKQNIIVRNLKQVETEIYRLNRQKTFIKAISRLKIKSNSFQNIIFQTALLTQFFKQKIITKSRFNSLSRISQKGRGGQGQGQGEGFVSPSKSSSASVSLTLQSQALRQAELSVLRAINEIPSGLVNKERLLTWFRFRFKVGRVSKQTSLKTGWIVYGLSKGAYRRLNKTPLSKQDALSRGAYAIDRTTSRTFKIVPIPSIKTFGRVLKREKGYFTFSKPKFREYRIIKGKKRALTYTLIEKRKYLIDTQGEKKGLSLYRYLAKLKKQGKY